MSTHKTLRSLKRSSMTRGAESRYMNKVEAIDSFYESGMKLDIEKELGVKHRTTQPSPA